MIALLAVVLTGLAGWLWTTCREPADRLRHIHPVSSPIGPPGKGRHGPASRVSPVFSASTRVTAGSRAAFSPVEKTLPPMGEALPPVARTAGAAPGGRRTGRGEVAASFAVGLATTLAVGGPLGIGAGLAGAGIALTVLRRRESPELRREREQVTADLPLAADLLVASLRAGQPITGALDVTVEAIGGPLGDRLAWVSGQLRWGAAPESAWGALASDRSLAPLARVMIWAALGGAPVADALTRLSDDSRHAARATSAAAAQRVGVQVMAPLGLCFLPAFVFLGIIPVIAGLAGEVLLP